MWRKIKRQEAKARGIKIVGARWVDINKGDNHHPNYRSRLVAMEFKTDEKPEWYAATPPSEYNSRLFRAL